MLKSAAWIRDAAEETGLDRDTAVEAARAVLQTLRDELTPEQNERLAQEMPAAIRELYFENWGRSRPANPVRDADAFLARVRERLTSPAAQPDLARIVRGTLRVVERHMAGPALKIRHMLPKEIRALWPSTIAEETLERHEEMAAQQREVRKQALHAEAGHERGAPMAPHQNRTPGEEHRGGPLPNRM